MELGWEALPLSHPREWHDRTQPPAGPSNPPSSFNQSMSSQRRRSSAAHTRPSLPPPHLPIPNIPEPEPHYEQVSVSESYSQEELYTYMNGTNLPPHSSSIPRPAASPNLTAVAAFSQSRMTASLPPTAPTDDLSDSPPPSILPTSSRLNGNRDLEVPAEARPRPPSTRRALTRALELAREAVQIDSASDNPQGAVEAYGRSVALLREVMESVRRGEDTTEAGGRRRTGRRRSVVAQDDEIRRLQTIHDTYADRMDMLSIIYSIPSVPYATPSAYSTPSGPAVSIRSASPAHSSSASVDSTEQSSVPGDTHISDFYTSYERDSDTMGSIGAAEGLPSPIGQPLTHPYATSAPYDVQPAPVSNRVSTQTRRTSRTNLPPPAPPPTTLPPPIPPIEAEEQPTPRQHLEVVNRQRGDSVGHRRTGSGNRLEALEEENERPEVVCITAQSRLESPPLPPLPSTDDGEATARGPSSPRISNVITPRPRGSSQASSSSWADSVQIINATTNQGTIFQRRSAKTSDPPTPHSSSPTESTASATSTLYPRSTASSLPANSSPSVMGRSRSLSQPGRRPPLAGRVSPVERPPLPVSAGAINASIPMPQRKVSKTAPQITAPLTVQTDFSSAGNQFLLVPPVLIGTPSTPTSPLPPYPPADPMRKPYHLMNLIRTTMTSPTGGYITRRLHVPQEVWSQGGAKLNNLIEKIRVVGILFSALEDLQSSSAEYFGAGNVSSGMALGIGSLGRKEGEAWIAKLEDFLAVCDGVLANFGKKLGVGEGFVMKKTTWGDKLGRRIDKFTNGKNLDSPAAYVQGLRKLFLHAQLLDEHTKAVTSQPLAPAYAAFPPDIRAAAEIRLKRSSEFFASVVLTFVIQDLSALLDKYVKKCEKWLAE